MSAIEYQATNLSCAARGYPLPTIVWYTPGGQKIDSNFLASAATNDSTRVYFETYSLDESISDSIVPHNSHLQSILHVKNVNKRTAGKYICKVANILDTSVDRGQNFSNISFEWSLVDSSARSSQVSLSYTPDPATNVAFFIMVGSSFIIAFVINLVIIIIIQCTM